MNIIRLMYNAAHLLRLLKSSDLITGRFDFRGEDAENLSLPGEQSSLTQRYFDPNKEIYDFFK